MRDFFDLRTVVLVGSETLRQAVRLIASCEFCSPDVAGLSFDYILDRITGNDPTVTDYLLEECGARCPQCSRGLTEKTLVQIA